MKQTEPQTKARVGDFLLEPHANSSSFHATIVIPQQFVSRIYEQLSLAQQEQAQPYGFSEHHAPLSYIQQHYEVHLLEQVEEFAFKFIVINSLYRQLRERKITIAGEPRLHNIEASPEGTIKFIFELTVLPSIAVHEWKYLPFKAPRRKKYKDLDRQVDLFLQEERQRLNDCSDCAIQAEDWVLIAIALADQSNKILLDGNTEEFWIRIGTEEADAPLQELFIGKKIGDTFFTSHEVLQDYFNEQTQSLFNYCVTIIDIEPNAYLCPEKMKKHFRLKTNKELHRKMIEVFSYRNDISLRRDMIEEAYQLLAQRNPIEIPHFLVLRQQEQLLELMHASPDYQVYKMQKDFKDFVEKLAYKQLQEILLITQLAYDQNVDINNEDIKNYLNLLKRPRTREFIYFQPPVTKSNGQEIPISAEELKHTCLREKALNFVLYHLNK